MRVSPTLAAGLFTGVLLSAPPAPPQESSQSKTVRARVQLRIGGPRREVEMKVHTVPVAPPLVGADEVDLQEGEIVLGVELDGQPVAYPVRYLAMTEVLNSAVGRTAVAPTW